jgi:hypothetical protein
MVIYYRHTRTIVPVLRQGSRFMPYGHWSAGYKHGNPDTTALLLLPALSAAPESPEAARTTALLKLRRAGLLPPPLWVPNLTVQSRAPSVTNGLFFHPRYICRSHILILGPLIHHSRRTTNKRLASRKRHGNMTDTTRKMTIGSGLSHGFTRTGVDSVSMPVIESTFNYLSVFKRMTGC